jgi:co-chaperonin GroES (HSP10)
MTIRLLRGRVAIREILPTKSGRIVLPDDYHDKHERDRTSHRGLVLAMGPPARTASGAEVTPGFAPGDVVHFVFALHGTEASRVNTWPADGGRVVWVAQEEVTAVEDADDETACDCESEHGPSCHFARQS